MLDTLDYKILELQKIFETTKQYPTRKVKFTKIHIT